MNACDSERMTVAKLDEGEASATTSPRVRPVVIVAFTDIFLVVADVDVIVAVGRDPTVVNDAVVPRVVPRRLVERARMK